MFKMFIHGIRLCLGLGLGLTTVAWADQPQPWEDVPLGSASYQSPLSAYRGFQPQESGDWRAANDTVAEIGGWQAYAAEVWEAGQAPSAEAESDSDPDDGPLHDHHHH
ncbi:hypothetical protein [Pseudomonas sp.]|jgi:hypothetical protein|uniref:hypothetical protein n=1 Tax=Pseudomonas sp. TaxID=306 RepID=UPI002729DA0C|nr:hypothetical protein [Pseudomonas sp.]